MTDKSPLLTESALKTLHLAATFGLLSITAVHRQVYAEKSYDAAKSLIRRLCGRPPRYRFLKPEPLGAKRVYYRLTKRATEHLGVPVHLARAFGPMARIDRYARLWFMCVDRSAVRRPVRPGDHDEWFKGLRQAGLLMYVEQSAAAPRLGITLVDHGRNAQQVYRRGAASLQRFIKHGWLADFLAAGNFELAVLTMTEEKKQLFESELPRQLGTRLKRELRPLTREHGGSLPFSISVHVVPHLIDILPEVR